MLNKNSKIFIAGHNGMVGSSIKRKLINRGYRNVILEEKNKLNLEDECKVKKFFKNERPEYVFLCAAKVGGIMANINNPSSFIKNNIRIQTNVIDYSYKYKAKKLLFLGSSCIYPKNAPLPLKEKYLLTGKMEESNLPYAVAKISGKVMCDAYYKELGFEAFTVMPCNIYGINDNFDSVNSHLVAGIIKKIHEAKINKKKNVVLWGTGKPKRELLNVDDLANACVHLMKIYKGGGMINVGSSDEISVNKLSILIKKIIDYDGLIKFDKTHPDGVLRKKMDNSKILKTGWKPKIQLAKGIEKMYEWYVKSQ